LLKEKIYAHSPVWAQNIAVSLYGFYWKKRRYGGLFRQFLSNYKIREGWSSSQWDFYQNECLRELLCHANATVPYYRKQFKDIQLSGRDLANMSIEHMASLPVLNKQTLRNLCKTDLMSTLPARGGSFFGSSGSTGTPVQIYYSNVMHQNLTAAYEARVRNWAGVNRFMSRGMIGGRRVVTRGDASPPFYRYNYAEKQLYFSAYHLQPDHIANYLHGLVSYRPEYMVGYAMSHYILAKFFKENNIKPPVMKAVLTSSEKMTAQMRTIIESTYSCKVFDAWSGVENCGLVSECEFGRLHISPDVGILEILNDQGEHCRPGEEGDVLCTGLLNFDQPLIRYQIGDRMRLAEEQSCPCGRSMPVIADICGRLEDLVTGPNGRRRVRFHGIFIGLDKISSAQVIQVAGNEFHVHVMSEGSLDEKTCKVIAKRMTSQLGSIELKIKRVSALERGKNGKFPAVISRIIR